MAEEFHPQMAQRLPQGTKHGCDVVRCMEGLVIVDKWQTQEGEVHEYRAPINQRWMFDRDGKCRQIFHRPKKIEPSKRAQ